jgi:SAM-dependent methyltransferase
MNLAAKAACTPEAFERRYRGRWDPWSFRTSAYERGRYEATLGHLPGNRYAFAYEPGCSIGELTALLAPRCDQVLATDVSPTAVARATGRCAVFHHVRVECRDVRETVLETAPDLIVLSELAYYLDAHELEILAAGLGRALSSGGTLIAVHWVGKSRDHVLHADEAHEVLLRALPLQHDLSERHLGFRIDRWSQE